MSAGKDCPFCGHIHQEYRRYGGKRAALECLKCGARGPIVQDGATDQLRDPHCEATAQWNERRA